jgi:hypothetical protein
MIGMRFTGLILVEIERIFMMRTRQGALTMEGCSRRGRVANWRQIKMKWPDKALVGTVITCWAVGVGPGEAVKG